MSTVHVLLDLLSRPVTRTWTTVLVSIFLYFNFCNFSTFTSNVFHTWFPFRKYFLENIMYIKTLQFQTILLPLKKCVTEKRTYVNKEYKLLNSYLLTILLSIFFNELPGGGVAIALPAGKFLLYNSYQCLATSNITSG